MKHYTGIWSNGITYSVLAYNGEDAWRQLTMWAEQYNIQDPTKLTITKE